MSTQGVGIDLSGVKAYIESIMRDEVAITADPEGALDEAWNQDTMR